MNAKTKAELVFIPSPGRGHLLATLEMAKQLVDRSDNRLSITVLVIKPFFDPKSSAHHNSHFPESNSSTIRFVEIPPPLEPLSISTTYPVLFQSQFIGSHKDHVRNEVAKIVQDLDQNSRFAGFVIDMFCTSMIDVANEFGVATYLFFTSGASSLGLLFHFQGLRDYENEDLTLFENSTDQITIPSYKFPVPAKILPSAMFDKEAGGATFLNHARRFRETKGILVNTFLELESHVMKSLSEDDEKIPPVYPIGPVLHLDDGGNDRNPKYGEIIKWLDEQPNLSVAFLCFGSRGCFDETQVKEIAVGLEQSGHRFLWALRKPPSDKFEMPREYDDPGEVLPEGFLRRTAEVGKVIGWAPQTAVLAHPAVGGFVSHCGWNSTLESVWCGVPMGAWPLYAEQEINAFQLVKDVGVAVEMKIDKMATADEVKNGIRHLMAPDSDTKVNMQAMKMKSRTAVMENGSSFEFMGRFIDNIIG